MSSRIKGLVVLLALIAAIAVDPGMGLSQDNTYKIYGDTDAPGFDYEAYSPPSLDSCQSQCGEDSRCKAFTYNHAKQVCFLKVGARVPLKRHEEATTGIKIGKDRFSTKKNKDAPGYDYRQFVPPTFNSCRHLCDQEPKCTSFTFNEAKRVCFLKSKRDIALIRHAGAITGVKIAETRAAPDVGSDSPPIQSFIATGTGLTVSDDGLVLTNSHVVEQCKSITVYDRGTARIKQIDQTNDLALLKIKGKTNAAKFRATSPRLGGSVYALGFPYSGVLSGSVNFTSGNISSLSGIRNDSRYLQFTAPVQPGNSGGPLVDDEGHVVGVVTGRLADIEVLKASGSLPQNVNFAIRGELAKSFLKANKVEPVVAETGSNLKAEDIAETAENFTVQIVCQQ